MKQKTKNWLLFSVVVVLYCIASDMEYEDEKNGYRSLSSSEEKVRGN